mmetsp:Transcript_26757/g.63453  ORF Transcript_26757/g.63453 Transcript_26757/m.63453 type:complete len:223 (+) Transcript_26757:526-1194(+)
MFVLGVVLLPVLVDAQEILPQFVVLLQIHVQPGRWGALHLVFHLINRAVHAWSTSSLSASKNQNGCTSTGQRQLIVEALSCWRGLSSALSRSCRNPDVDSATADAVRLVLEDILKLRDGEPAALASAVRRYEKVLAFHGAGRLAVCERVERAGKLLKMPNRFIQHRSTYRCRSTLKHHALGRNREQLGAPEHLQAAEAASAQEMSPAWPSPTPADCSPRRSV